VRIKLLPSLSIELDPYVNVDENNSLLKFTGARGPPKVKNAVKLGLTRGETLSEMIVQGNPSFFAIRWSAV
jgi:hypothetical protein